MTSRVLASLVAPRGRSSYDVIYSYTRRDDTRRAAGRGRIGHLSDPSVHAMRTLAADPEAGELAVCRICLSEDDPMTLIAPCLCAGTSRWVHRDCLDEVCAPANQRLQKKNGRRRTSADQFFISVHA